MFYAPSKNPSTICWAKKTVTMEALAEEMDRLYNLMRRLGVKTYTDLPIARKTYQASTRAFAIFSSATD
jgi:hypothetical protein